MAHLNGMHGEIDVNNMFMIISSEPTLEPNNSTYMYVAKLFKIIRKIYVNLKKNQQIENQKLRMYK